jgi:outer membrane lipoprotein carrier protein
MYESIGALRAEFTQTMTSSYTKDAATSSGVLILKGDQYRIETGKQVLVTDGKVTYVYLPAEKQVLINDFVKDETSFSPSDFLLNYGTRFNVTKAEAVQLAGQKHYKLSLTPKKPDSFFTKATIWMRDRDDIITMLEVIDVNETTMTFSLKNVQLNPSLKADTFTFRAPAGAEVIDLRS